ncbi:MAG: gliding motility protein [Burkholderiales bacterium]|nr:gliding motility protein [Flavobacterium sp.]
MKTNILRYFSIAGLIFFLIACSTKRNSFLSRNSHALSSKYNILYNGGVALDKGIVDLKGQYNDNFWDLLPIERMQIKKEEATLPGQPSATPNPNFDRAETKSTKAIQKHSMNIGGAEKNPQMDEAYLMLGKSRYYDQRFVPALDAFNYILYKYPNSDKIYEAKIWREKTNIRMDNDALAVNNLTTLLKEIKFKDQIFADANAILGQAFLNLEQKDSAVAKLKLARDFTKQKEEKARYRFILGQLYEQLGYKDSAFASYQEVIDMKRQSARQYVIHAHLRQARQFDFEKGDTVAFLKKFNNLLKDRENRPYLDALNHQLGLFYDSNKKFDVAAKYYNTSLKEKKGDHYLMASNYRNLADIYFNKAKYVTAGKYYDSTLVQLEERSREFKAIKKKRENLVDVIKYEGIATRNDSIIKIYALSETDRIAYYQRYIDQLKKEDEAQKLIKDKALKDGGGSDGSETLTGKEEVDANGRTIVKSETEARKSPTEPPTSINGAGASGATNQSNFYFYNATTVAFGKAEFRKNWGNRTLKNNWRLSTSKPDANPESEDALTDATEEEKTPTDQKTDEAYSTNFYIKQLPKNQASADSIAKERNFAYYQLGVIYKEKFKEYQLAANKLETLLNNSPEERLVLPTMYNLYKIYEIINNEKALAMKNKIIGQFPESRYAQILGKGSVENNAGTDSPEAAYDKLYKLYNSADYKKVFTEASLAIDQYTGEPIVPKFELLKANTIGKIKGVAEYKKALNFVALNYPNSDEGKLAEQLLASDVPKLESLRFYALQPLSWKILYKSDNPDDKNTKKLQEKIKKFITDRTLDKLTMSYDMYTMSENFIVIHGMKTEEYAKGIASILKEFKEYKVTETAYIISNDNYKIVQIKKNFEEYLTTPPTAPLPPEPDPAVRERPTPKVSPVAPKAVREEATDDKRSDFNQLPPSMPLSPGAPPQDAPQMKQNPGVIKEKR